MSYIAALLKQI
uniref:Uncharacterized protein n=1 Tax=Anguilla anguilla TaxID=7936 RepID=A0A0E9SX71_ANGAN